MKRDLLGLKFGLLTVIEEDIPNKWGQSRYRCKCDCGNTKIIHGGSMVGGRTRSCGCLQGEANRKRMCLPWGEAEKNIIISNYAKSATHRGLPFELTKEQFLELASMNCTYCGSKPSNKLVSSHGANKGVYVYNGLDRVDNSRGYTIDNVVTCCKNCNFAKRKIPLADFLEWVSRVYNHSVVGRNLGESLP